jgi:hypothetical protein
MHECAEAVAAQNAARPREKALTISANKKKKLKKWN